MFNVPPAGVVLCCGQPGFCRTVGFSALLDSTRPCDKPDKNSRVSPLVLCTTTHQVFPVAGAGDRRGAQQECAVLGRVLGRGPPCPQHHSGRHRPAPPSTAAVTRPASVLIPSLSMHVPAPVHVFVPVPVPGPGSMFQLPSCFEGLPHSPCSLRLSHAPCSTTIPRPRSAG